MKEINTIMDAVLRSDAGDLVLATLVAVEGSSYRRPGARLLVLGDGTRLGSISGGCLEEDVVARAHRVRSSGTAETVVYDTTSENDLVWGVGLGCNGIVRVLIEKLPLRPPWVETLAENFARRQPTALAVVHAGDDPAALGTRLAPPGESAAGPDIFHDVIAPPVALTIFGAGDDAKPLCSWAKELGWVVTVADPRPASATRQRFPAADALVVAPAEQLVGRVAPGPDTLAVVMTHHYAHDVPLLRELLARPLRYIGLLGPRLRAERILAELAADGVEVTPEQRARLHAPVGLDLGADSPEQVALAVVAEMQAVLGGRDGRPLRDRTRPIHA
jgi:xanthine dehydrogenase accessory factor